MIAFLGTVTSTPQGESLCPQIDPAAVVVVSISEQLYQPVGSTGFGGTVIISVDNGYDRS